MVMVRPRAGRFCYSEEDFAAMRRDAALLLEHGADGIVFGMLRADSTVDTKRCGDIVEIAGDKQTVFHRAFDEVSGPSRALEELIGLGFTRVLTSGQRETAHEGRALIRRLIHQAAARIEVLPGGKVRTNNVLDLVNQTGCTQVHLRACSDHPDAANSSGRQVDPQVVQRMRRVLDEIGNSE